MRIVKIVMMTLLSLGLDAQEFYVPPGYQCGETIDRLILICDVDGVVRDNVESKVDHRVVQAIRSLIARGNVDVTFLSGTPVDNDQNVELWRRGNTALNEAFGFSFQQEQHANQVTILGGFGGQKLHPDGSVEDLEGLSFRPAFQICFCMIERFLKQVCLQGAGPQKQLARQLLKHLSDLTVVDDEQSPSVTAREFEPIAVAIRAGIDPMFRILCNTCVMEIQMSPGWDVAATTADIRAQIESLELPTPKDQRQIVHGRGRRNGEQFDFILFGTTNKGVVSAKLIKEKMAIYPQALVVTVGDTQGDYPMHVNADLGFHVGLEKVWKDHSLAQSVMVRGSLGEDSQHVEGTLAVLQMLDDALGKSFFKLKYIASQHPDLGWRFVAPADIGMDCSTKTCLPSHPL